MGKNSIVPYYILALLSIPLLMAWGSSWLYGFLFVAFIPLFFLIEKLTGERKIGELLLLFLLFFGIGFFYAYWVHLEMNAFSYHQWVYAFHFSVLFFTYYSLRSLSPLFRFFIFLSLWLGSEYLISWLVLAPHFGGLGYGLMGAASYLSWSAFTGPGGLSLWILLVNWSLYMALFYQGGIIEGQFRKTSLSYALLLLILPVIIAFSMNKRNRSETTLTLFKKEYSESDENFFSRISESTDWFVMINKGNEISSKTNLSEEGPAQLLKLSFSRLEEMKMKIPENLNVSLKRLHPEGSMNEELDKGRAIQLQGDLEAWFLSHPFAVDDQFLRTLDLYNTQLVLIWSHGGALKQKLLHRKVMRADLQSALLALPVHYVGATQEGLMDDRYEVPILDAVSPSVYASHGGVLDRTLGWLGVLMLISILVKKKTSRKHE